MMVLEDLNYKELRLIGAMIPNALTFPIMKKVIKDIMLSYDLGEEDAATAFFIAQECEKHYKDIDKIITRRTKDLIEERDKQHRKLVQFKDY